MDTGDFGAENLDPEFEAQLAEVAAFLAAVPDPAMPPSVEARISAAIAAEAAGAEGAESPRTRYEVADLSAFARRSRWRKLRSFEMVVAAAACLVLLAVGGYLASVRHDSNGRMSATPAVSAGETSVSAAAGTAGTAQGAQSHGMTTGGADRGVPAALAPEASASSSSPANEVPFLVTMSGTKYAPATLAAQAKAKVAGYTSIQNAQATTGAASSMPSAALFGCVEHFTRGSEPRLVDRGTYRGTPAYVIVGESKVWVVGLGCTASRPELLASAALTG